MRKRIACLDLDAFFVEAALLKEPQHRGKPVAVGGNSKRAIVCSASYEARKYGVSSAMPIWMARQRCPSIRVLPVPDNISELSWQVNRLLARFCPVVEKASVDEFYLDFTGCDRIYPSNLNLAENIIATIESELEIPATMGFATSKLLSKIASNLGKPRGILEVLPGGEKAFLSVLPIKEIPGIGKKTEPVLKSMGIHHVGDVLALPLDVWRAAFGKLGEYIFDAARGICASRVVPSEQKPLRKAISRDTTLQVDSASRYELLGHLSRLLESATFQLQKEKLTCASVTVKIRYSDFVSATRTSKITRTSDDKDIYPVVAKLFNGLFSRRVRVRLVGIQLGAIQAGNVTPDLWDILQPEYKNQLPEVIQIIRAKFGFSSILRSRSIVNQNETRNNHH